MMQAIIYSRWSSLEQGCGTSAVRQQEICGAFAKRQGWRISQTLSDEGKSAWTGDNITTGNLGKLAKRFEQQGAQDVVLVVEKLDRLSRRPAIEMSAWLQKVLATGLTIVTADGRHHLDTEKLTRDNMAFIAVVFDAFRGFDEGQVKSERVAAAWQKKRERGAPMTARCPAWLRPSGSTSFKADQSNSMYELIRERADVIAWMFEQSLAGIGAATIAAQLNQRNEPVWGRGDGWHDSYVKKILTSPAVIGEYQPCTRPKGGKRVPAGEPIKDYFPAAIPVELFVAVNDPRAQRIRQEQSGHNRLGNLFSGLARCNHCDATMTFLDKGTETLADGSLAPRRYLKCSRVHRSVGRCTNRRSYSYALAERAILDELLDVAMDDQHFASEDAVGQLEAEVARLKRERADAERRQAATMALVEADTDDELAVRRYKHHKEQANAAKLALKAAENRLADARGKVTPAQHVKRVAEVRNMLDDGDPESRYQARYRVKLALNDLIDSVAFSDHTRRIWVRLKGSVRHIAFDLTGKKQDDWEWARALDTNATDPVIGGYLRRRGY